MNTGKTVFTQLMTMLPEYEFDKCVARYKRFYRVRNFSCRDHFNVMSFAQLTLRESLWDIENCLTAFSSKLYHCGIKHTDPRNTLAKANELWDWQIYADFAQVLIGMARPLYQDDKDFHLDIDNLVYAFDRTSISLRLTLCPWATFREHKGDAIYSQIWIAICICLLIAIAKKRMCIEQSLYTFSQTLGLTLFERMLINVIVSKTATERISDVHPMLFSYSDF